MKTESIIEYLNAVKDINNVSELNINKFDILGNILIVDLNDLKLFNNLEKLTLCNLILNEDDMIIISSLNKLKSLELYNCEFIFSELSSYFNNMSLNELLIDGVNISFNLINNVIDKVIIKNIILNEKVKCNNLDIHKSDVEFDKLNLLNYKSIIMSQKQYNNNKNLFESLKGKVHVIVMNDDYEDIEVEYE